MYCINVSGNVYILYMYSINFTDVSTIFRLDFEPFRQCGIFLNSLFYHYKETTYITQFFIFPVYISEYSPGSVVISSKPNKIHIYLISLSPYMHRNLSDKNVTNHVILIDLSSVL